MKFIVGIGNPGKKYENTRHNVGFRVLDGLIGGFEAEIKKKLPKRKKFQAEIFETPKALLIKPETFVNLTGESASAILREYKASSQDFLFLCDDVNLMFGKLRLRSSGSAGGHHGLEDIIGHFDSQDFPRLRLGIRTEKMPKDLTGFVLEKFSPEEKEKLKEILEKAVSICESWLKEGFEAAQNKLSRLQSIQ